MTSDQRPLDDWLLAHEHHTLHFGREHGNVAGAITCASPHDDGPRNQRFTLAALSTTPTPELNRLRAIKEAARAIVETAEPDCDPDGQFIEFLVPSFRLAALRAALEGAPDDQ